MKKTTLNIEAKRPPSTFSRGVSKLLLRILYKGQNHNVPTVSMVELNMVEFIFRIRTSISHRHSKGKFKRKWMKGAEKV